MTIPKPRYSKVATTELKPIRNNGKPSIKVMIEKSYLLRPVHTPVYEEIETLISELMIWVQKDSSLRLNDFCAERKIAYKVFCDWRDKWPILDDAVQEAKWFIASRRELAALQGKYNVPMTLRAMPIFDKDWRELLELQTLKDQQKHTGPQIVVIERAPSSDMVPERKKDKD